MKVIAEIEGGNTTVSDVKPESGDNGEFSELRNFARTFQDLMSQKDVVVSNVNPNDEHDKTLVLRIALRGKTEDQYWEIVDGLQTLNLMENDEAKKRFLTDLAGDVMSIGRRELGIDWS